MFTISNRIAYDGLMVQGRPDDGAFSTWLGESHWIDVPTVDGTGHFSEAEGAIATRLVRLAFEEAVAAGREHPDLFLIAPFRACAIGLRKGLDTAGFPRRWIRRHVGTIHTFQGREADMVVLVLGGEKGRDGALAWASSAPNLVNVAVTRSRHRLYVVGDATRWGHLPFFETVHARLPQRAAWGGGPMTDTLSTAK
jgi:superfamily I DNA and/or RNA helicase